MIVIALILLGLCLGSFVNALVWRIHEQQTETDKKTPDRKYQKRLSVTRGRSMCPHCKHELIGRDLIPLLSWLSLAGKCRYCHKHISYQYPLVEAMTAALFVFSYYYWPNPLNGIEHLAFGLWLIILTGLVALTVYDLKWYILPDRITYPLSAVAALLAIVEASRSDDWIGVVLSTVLAVIVGGGIFYTIYQISAGKWIGGGDVKLGWLLGLIVATPAKSVLFIFLASILGTLISLPLLATKKLSAKSVVPFGPFLIAGAVITVLFGPDILDWYQHTLINL